MPFDVDAVRAHFPALQSGAAFFDGPGGSQTPGVVADAVAAALAAPLSNRGTVTAAERNADEIVLGARAAIGDLLHTEPEGVIFGRSMTQLTYDLARALAKQWGPGDEVVVTRLDHDGNIRPWVQAAEHVGATIRWADFDPDTGELTADDVAQQLSERTRLVAVTGASNLIGTRPPIPEIAAVAHAAPAPGGHGALVYLDAVHLAAHALVDRTALGVDFVVCSPYKFLGPHCGVLAADPRLLDTIHPDKLAPATEDVPERFELGTLPYELLAGTTAAVDFIASLGDGDGDGGGGGPGRRARLTSAYEAIEAHEDALRAELEDGLAELDGVTVHSRAAHRTPTLLLTFEGRDAIDVSVQLAAQNVNAPASNFYAMEASHRMGLGDAGGLRIGIAPYTDAEDVERLVSGLELSAIAAERQ
jgi:cysteine desulfurase family protein (TIGR01976 family)